jgi:hypothetical protein
MKSDGISMWNARIPPLRGAYDARQALKLALGEVR